MLPRLSIHHSNASFELLEKQVTREKALKKTAYSDLLETKRIGAKQTWKDHHFIPPTLLVLF